MTERAAICERCGSALLDGHHIASNYPPCNGRDDIRDLRAAYEAARAIRDAMATRHHREAAAADKRVVDTAMAITKYENRNG